MNEIISKLRFDITTGTIHVSKRQYLWLLKQDPVLKLYSISEDGEFLAGWKLIIGEEELTNG